MLTWHGDMAWRSDIAHAHARFYQVIRSRSKLKLNYNYKSLMIWVMLSLLELQMSHVSDFKMPLCICIYLTGKLFCKHFQKKKLNFWKGGNVPYPITREIGENMGISCGHLVGILRIKWTISRRNPSKLVVAWENFLQRVALTSWCRRVGRNMEFPLRFHSLLILKKQQYYLPL